MRINEAGEFISFWENSRPASREGCQSYSTRGSRQNFDSSGWKRTRFWRDCIRHKRKGLLLMRRILPICPTIVKTLNLGLDIPKFLKVLNVLILIYTFQTVSFSGYLLNSSHEMFPPHSQSLRKHNKKENLKQILIPDCFLSLVSVCWLSIFHVARNTLLPTFSLKILILRVIYKRLTF